MESITFTCETITPMFMAGADGITPELRAPSIKGALRFWWRAMNGHLSLENMKKVEGEIFGSTEKRSKVIIRVIQKLKESSFKPLLPHKPDSFKSNGFNEKLQFEIKFSLTSSEHFTLEQLKSLFILTVTLGGFGKRSRRGMGSVKILNTENLPKTKEDILTMIKIINPKFSYNSNAEYPIIKNIEIGKNPKSPSNIGQATHETMGQDPTDYKASLGGGSPRFASPIYISILGNGLPVITTLQTVSPTPNNVKAELQEQLKDKIL